MKQCFHIFLALLIATTSAPSGQGVASVLKMTTFVHHFMHHVLCHGDITGVKDFVLLHYSHDEHHEEDHQEHENLPFSHHHQDQPSPAQHVLYLLPQAQTIVFPYAEIAANNLTNHQAQWLSSHVNGDIWQPPKA